MKNIEFYYDEIYKLRNHEKMIEFAKEKGMKEWNGTSNFQDLLIWLNEEHRILDKTEKKYISNIIKPLKTDETTVEKVSWMDREYIAIHHLKSLIGCEDASLPCFKKGKMYRGMEQNREYSLKELGL